MAGVMDYAKTTAVLRESVCTYSSVRHYATVDECGPAVMKLQYSEDGLQWANFIPCLEWTTRGKYNFNTKV